MTTSHSDRRGKTILPGEQVRWWNDNNTMMYGRVANINWTPNLILVLVIDPPDGTSYSNKDKREWFFAGCQIAVHPDRLEVGAFVEQRPTWVPK